MSKITVRRCPTCGYDDEIRGRQVVVCDTCGTRADMIRCQIRRVFAPPPGWIGGFYYEDIQSDSKVTRMDFCGWRCGRDFERWHIRALVYS